MTTQECDALWTTLAAGKALRVPFSTTLFPEARADVSTLRLRPDGQVDHTTVFHEHAAGHGWSTEQTEKEILSAEQARGRLLACNAQDVTVVL